MTLDPADYWKLRALDGDIRVAQQALQMLTQRRQQTWMEIVAKYGLDAARGYAARDDDCSLSESA